MKKYLLVGVLSCSCALFGSLVMAQYTGPQGGAQSAASVAEILRNPVEDQEVRLQGYLLRKISHESYLFSDGTAEIQIEIDDDKLPAGAFDHKTRVEISGKVDKNRLRSTEIDVDWLRIVK